MRRWACRFYLQASHLKYDSEFSQDTTGKGLDLTGIRASSYTTPSFVQPSGQVAQLVERGPEKAGVGGSIPSLATINFNNLQIAKNIQKSSRVQYAYIGLPYSLFRADRFK